MTDDHISSLEQLFDAKLNLREAEKELSKAPNDENYVYLQNEVKTAMLGVEDAKMAIKRAFAK